MDSRLRDLNNELKKYDRQLYVDRDLSGKLHIYRRKSSISNDYVFSLTEDWTTRGAPANWGVLPILNRLRAMDLQSHPDIFKELEDAYNKSKESKQRDTRNNVESFLLDFRRQFAKATNEINTGTLEKIDRRRSIENGNRQS